MMGWCRRSSIIFDALRRYNSKAVNSFYFRSNSNSNSSRLRISQILQNVIKIKNNHRCNHHPFVNGAKSLYFADRNNVYHFKKKRWSQNSRTICLLGSGAVISVYLWNLETIPYTNRTHFVLVSTSIEKRVGQFMFDFFKSEEWEGKILPIDHPDSIRVRKIGHDIIGALQKRLRKEEDDDLDQHKHMSMNMKKKKKKKSQTAHLEEFEWEFIVVDDTSIYNAYCFPGGKIVLFTGLLRCSKSDAEIAATVGHEVGHSVARHSAEKMSGILWLVILQFFIPYVAKKMSDLFVRLPFSRRNEKEADYIGLLLMASAGYDPQAAPEMFKRIRVSSRWEDIDYLSTHPHGKRRAQLLSEPKVMEEALSLYREALKEKEKEKEVEVEVEVEAEENHPVNFLNRFAGSFVKS